MNELLNIGINPDSINFSLNSEDHQIANYQDQITKVTMKAWGRYWSQRISEAVVKSDLFFHIATTTAKVAGILEIEKFPRLGLLNGFEVGKINYLGYCWEDAGQTWVGFDELWFGDVAAEVAEQGGNVSPCLRDRISFVLAEEVFHAYIREVKPDLAEENIQANASRDPEVYRNSRVELAAKEFAGLYVMRENS